MLIEDTIFTASHLLLETGLPFYLVIGATPRQCKEVASFFVIFKTLSIGQALGIPILQSSAPLTDLSYPAQFAAIEKFVPALSIVYVVANSSFHVVISLLLYRP